MEEVLRTPEERFKNLPKFPYKPKYIHDLKSFEKLRMHYIDEGQKDSDHVFLCLHGQPTWCFLYRKMIPSFLNRGYRVIAPDFFGFGRSDKPVYEQIYSFTFHRDSLISLLNYLDLKNIILVCQDWGGLLGLTLPMEFPDKFTHLIIMNTILGTGDFEISKGFRSFKDWVNNTPDINIGRLLKRGTPILSEAEIKAYDAPFPDIKYKAGVRTFPKIVPIGYDDPGAEISRRARDYFQSEWNGNSFMAIGMQDPVLGPPMMKILQTFIPNIPEPLKIEEAGHFVQEWGDIVAEKALDHFKL